MYVQNHQVNTIVHYLHQVCPQNHQVNKTVLLALSVCTKSPSECVTCVSAVYVGGSQQVCKHNPVFILTGSETNCSLSKNSFLNIQF